MPFSVRSLALFPDRRMYSDPIDARWGKRGTRRRESWQKQKQGVPRLEAWAVAGLPTRKLAEIEECHLHSFCAWDGREGGYPRKSHLSGFSFSSLGTSVSQFWPLWAFRRWLRNVNPQACLPCWSLWKRATLGGPPGTGPRALSLRGLPWGVSCVVGSPGLSVS